MKKTKSIGRKRKWIIRTYNLVTGSEVTDTTQIPACALCYFLNMPFNNLIEPYIIERLRKGDSINTICQNYDVDFHIVRRVGRKLKLLK